MSQDEEESLSLFDYDSVKEYHDEIIYETDDEETIILGPVPKQEQTILKEEPCNFLKEITTEPCNFLKKITTEPDPSKSPKKNDNK